MRPVRRKAAGTTSSPPPGSSRTNPIVGAGIGNDLLALNDYRDRDTYRSVHNAYLQYAVDLGLPGLMLFAWLHILCFRSVRRLERRAQHDDAFRTLGPLAGGVQVSLVAFFVAAMFHPIAYQFYFFTHRRARRRPEEHGARLGSRGGARSRATATGRAAVLS